MPALMNSGASFLSRLPLFADVSPETLARLEHRMRRQEFAPRSAIVREGGSDSSAFLVLSGRVAVRRKDPESGIEFLLAELGEGAMFGEMALLTRKPRTASAVALDDVRQVVKGVVIEPAVVAEDDFKRFMASSYPRLVAEDAAAVPPQRQGTPRPATSGAAKPAGSPPVDLLESDLIRELQLAAGTEDEKVETNQDLMSASEDAPIIKLANSILGLAISVSMDSKPIDFRVSTVPGKRGEKVCMRILDRSSAWLLTEGLTTVEEVTSVVSVEI